MATPRLFLIRGGVGNAPSKPAPPGHWLADQVGDFPWGSIDWRKARTAAVVVGSLLGCWATLIAITAGAIALVRSGW